MKHTRTLSPAAIKLVTTGTNPSDALVNMYSKEDWSVTVINMNATHLSKQHSLETPCTLLNNKIK
jgi:hypothetical protein